MAEKGKIYMCLSKVLCHQSSANVPIEIPPFDVLMMLVRALSHSPVQVLLQVFSLSLAAAKANMYESRPYSSNHSVRPCVLWPSSQEKLDHSEQLCVELQTPHTKETVGLWQHYRATVSFVFNSCSSVVSFNFTPVFIHIHKLSLHCGFVYCCLHAPGHCSKF